MKTIREQFDSHFSEENLLRIFEENVVYSGGTGIDNINQYTFRQQLKPQIEIISRKMISGDYCFTKYKLSLISKGRGKPPREISIPTVRDRIALRAMCDFLQERFENGVKFELPQTVIKRIKSEIDTGQYTGCIKLDVSDFYPSIVHDLLEKQLDKRLRKHPDIKSVIFSAISSPTVVRSSKDDSKNNQGVPQGLSISNILAAIYLQDLDRYLGKIEGAKCYRYVDDILVLCDKAKAKDISSEIIKKFADSNLDIHCPIKMPHKSMIGDLSDGFDYLGYDFCGSQVSVKQGSIDKLKASLVGIFTSYKYSEKQNQDFLAWRINIRITGCIFENKSKGWLFFFSEINDEALLHKLDYFVYKLCRRFDVDIKPKKFVRAFKEISNRKYVTKYVPNFDNYSVQDMGKVLTTYFGYNLKNMRDDQIKYSFHKKVSKQIKDLEADIKDFSASG
ncbi:MULTISPECIES: reverse transcriptase domain-containing protein [Vibrio harveyi group]|uniref:reverse transcriptase domain-containing protein n=1 Tax=Vibrio harveyi group TaxID=717610 RepID=UPI00044DE406|nr:MULTISPECIES: reverse transcriptase domain-containing protein [Vibrio harveyi group]ELA7353731.1 RNA-dependent DNA polymerase [Vibrio alginolyticus]EGR3003239.1 RNA-dependent DNA polymerase [Vibrio parahaemolyticus]EGR3365710.1 RNA-dependent DNA polymerase [Vibrio parahaemolyticus]EHK9055438.1 RNA-dependent DNA polymerase [Vibrio parahaemolyticus]EHR0159593.1 RNA-dependent DNA polymerase [Vibrio parahaemolyticus]